MAPEECYTGQTALRVAMVYFAVICMSQTMELFVVQSTGNCCQRCTEGTRSECDSCGLCPWADGSLNVEDESTTTNQCDLLVYADASTELFIVFYSQHLYLGWSMMKTRPNQCIEILVLVSENQ